MTAKVSDFIPDEHNANKGTERGLKMLDDSLRQYGAGRSILVDKHGRVIAGNKTLERAADVGIKNVRVVETDGTELVAVKRTDLDLLTDVAARELAYADNRVGEADLTFDPAQIAADLEAGVDLSGLWLDWELEQIKLAGSGPDDPNEEWQGMPGFEQEDKTACQSIHVHFRVRADVEAFAELIGQKLTEETRAIWFPEAKKTNMKDFYDDANA